MVNDSLQIKEFNNQTETALNSPAKKILFGQKALELNRNTILRFQKAKSHFFIGLGYQELGEYDVSMEHFFKTYNLFKAEADIIYNCLRFIRKKLPKFNRSKGWWWSWGRK